jgi:hypothetical protein
LETDLISKPAILNTSSLSIWGENLTQLVRVHNSYLERLAESDSITLTANPASNILAIGQGPAKQNATCNINSPNANTK